MTTPGRSVGGAARGLITPSPSSSLGVPAPFNEMTSIRRLRVMLASLDRFCESLLYVKKWYGDFPQKYRDADAERRLIRERIKQLAWLKKQEKK